MFGLFKKKLMDVVDKFSRKTEEESIENLEQKEETKKNAVEKPEEKIEETKPKKFLGLFKLREKEIIKEESKEDIDKNEVKITYFVHGTTTDNEKDLVTGWSSGELSELGIKQVKELSKLVSDKHFDIVFCSDLKRAVDSAELGFGDKYKIIQDKRLRECNYGDFTGKPAEKFKNKMVNYVDNPFPNGESYKDVEKRIADFLNFLGKRYSRKHVAIVSHQAPQLALEVLTKKKTWSQAISEDWRNKKIWQPGWEYSVSENFKFGEQIREKTSFFEKLKGITKVKINEEKFERLFEELEVILLENNVAYEVIDKIKEYLKQDIVDVPVNNVKKTIQDSLRKSIDEILTFDKINLIDNAKKKKPYVILFLGVNGAGKTTTIAKLCNLFLKNNLKCVLVAADTFRAASIQQLEEHAKKLNVGVIKHDYGADPAAVAFDGIKHAEARNIDMVLIDTAGRQHSNANLMDELKKINRIAKPDFKIFIGESITGNDIIEQVQQFDKAIEIDGIILSKLDVDDKGGAAISVSYVTGKPILYYGNGQDYDNLEEFDKEKILNSFDI